MPTPRKTSGRPKTGRARYIIRFTGEEIERLDSLRKSKAKKQARGVYLGGLVMKQPLNPFEKFRLLRRS